MKILEMLKTFTQTIKGIVTVAIVALILGYLLSWWNRPSIVQPSVIPVHDSTKVSQAVKDIKKTEEHKQNLIEKILGTHKTAQPIEINTSKPEPSPYPKEVIKVVKDTVYRFYNMGFIVGGDVGSHTVLFTSLNPYLEETGQDYMTTTTFKRDGENFLFSANGGVNGGVNLVWNDSPLKFRGFRAGGAMGHPQDWYVYFKCRIELYSIGIEPELRAYKSPIWISIDWRF